MINRLQTRTVLSRKPTKKELALLLIAISFTAGPRAQASLEDSNKNIMSVERTGNSVESPKGFWPFLGIGGGWASHDINNKQDGTPLQIKLMGSYYLTDRPWVLEGGLGLQNYRFTSNSRPRDSSTNGLIDLAARYQFGERWQVGPQVFSAIGNGDDYSSNNNTFTTYVGGQLLKEWNGSSNIYRLGGRAMVDLSIPERTSTVGMVEFHMSFGGEHKQVAKEEPKVEPKAIQTLIVEPNKIILPQVNFDTGKVEPYKDVSNKIRELAEVLAKNAALFGSVTISGHADERGPDSVNNILSLSRAQNIRQTLIQAGLSDSKIRVIGYGENRPLQKGRTAKALLMNRRVEIEFNDVKDQSALDKILSRR